ncbi:hypothetical protein HGM15179_021557 [Zosterops borbonicus]|uniref:Uncharacterized protein n=1 Tax=Zosterops borbonicus TaxID=364589 RepID=A0A8K1D477_9PASS|nr:hypothetical protein HGM15179_021557 [Zosterops borbonicus]
MESRASQISAARAPLGTKATAGFSKPMDPSRSQHNDQAGDGDSGKVRNKSLKSELRFGVESVVTMHLSSHGKVCPDSEMLPKENGLVGPSQKPTLTMAKAQAALAFVTPRASQPGTEEDSGTAMATCPSPKSASWNILSCKGHTGPSVQLLALHRHPHNPTLCIPGSIAQTLLELW